MKTNNLLGLVIVAGIVLIIAAFFAPASFVTPMIVVGFLAIPVGVYLWLFGRKNRPDR
ncbi:MAG TPA: hypothetical protein VMT26_05455 [Candidatus Bathyarchaeia archaeon]|nr:hypothetical protein [Candidatus Bathyarchaeia archaeon]